MKLYRLLMLLGLTSFLACTDLEETLNEDLTREVAEKFINGKRRMLMPLLEGAYNGMRLVSGSVSLGQLRNIPSDEVIGPTRGPDWDDNGILARIARPYVGTRPPFLENTFTNCCRL
ncbi:MAG: hypothetical protein R2784_12075 [Saprospiraceae bacterium]